MSVSTRPYSTIVRYANYDSKCDCSASRRIRKAELTFTKCCEKNKWVPPYAWPGHPELLARLSAELAEGKQVDLTLENDMVRVKHPLEPRTFVVEPTAVEPTAVEPTAVEPTAVEPTAVEPTFQRTTGLIDPGPMTREVAYQDWKHGRYHPDNLGELDGFKRRRFDERSATSSKKSRKTNKGACDIPTEYDSEA